MEPEPLIPDAVERKSLRIAANLLSHPLSGGEVELELVERFPQFLEEAATLLRCRAAPGGRRLVLKRAGEYRDPLFDEWAALRIVDRVTEPGSLAPAWVGGQMESALLVMSDLGCREEERMGTILFAGNQARAEQALLGHQRALGRLHALTAGRAAEYRELRATLPLLGRKGRHRVNSLEEALFGLPNRLEAWGCDGGTAVRAEVDSVVASLRAAGPWEVLTHGDPTPANAFLVDDGQVLLLDFETSAPRHAMVDGAFANLRYLHSVWARALPESLQRSMLSVYREELCAGCVEAQDDAKFAEGLAAGCAAWLAGLLAKTSPEDQEDRRWGRGTVRQRVMAALSDFGRTVDGTGQLPRLAEAARRLRSTLVVRWSESDLELQPYPALAGQ